MQERTLWLDGYITTLLQRDVKMLADIDKIAMLPTLLSILATRTGSLLNEADIARDLCLKAVTCKQNKIFSN